MQRHADIELLETPDLTVFVDGHAVPCARGESVLGVLFAVGKRAITEIGGPSPGGAACGMGICYACRVVIDDVPNQRACQRIVRDGMRVATGAARPRVSSSGAAP